MYHPFYYYVLYLPLLPSLSLLFLSPLPPPSLSSLFLLPSLSSLPLPLSFRYKLMQVCWETSPSERLHFAQIVEYMAHYLEHVNNKRDSYFSEDEEEEGEDGDLTRKSSRPSRNSSVRSGQSGYEYSFNWFIVICYTGVLYSIYLYSTLV